MSLGNTTLWGDVLPGGPLSGDSQAGDIDTTQVIDELLATLHVNSRAELAPWWTEAELIEWMDEALKRLSRVACVFVGRQGSQPLTVATQAQYTLPVQHVATLHVSYGAASLRPANMMELEARDPAFQTTLGTPDHWYEDLLGMAAFGITPVPVLSDIPLPMIYEGWPTALDPGGGQTLVPAPPPLKGYLAMAVIAQAYGAEGEMEAPDIAQHCRGRLDLYETLLQTYYGKGM